MSVGRRTGLAVLLTATAVAVPSVSWYVVGSREAERRATEVEEASRRLVGETAARLTEGLVRRLEALREMESARPYYHYQNLYHDPRSVSEGASVLPSPLAEGPGDPLVRTYFQVRPNGRVTLPTLNEEGLKTAGSEAAAHQGRILEELRPATQACLAAVRSDPGSNVTEVISVAGADPPRKVAPQQVKLERFKTDAWVQNSQVNRIYSQIQQRLPVPQVSTAPRREEIIVRTGPLGWHTLGLRAGAALAALRRVVTPEGEQAQGFLVSSSEIARMLAASSFRSSFLPGPPSRAQEFEVPLEGARWHLKLEAEPALELARRRAASVRSDFRRLFWSGLVAAIISASSLVILVWQTERLAQRRSQLAASAAHELRTPLAGLRMYSEMLAEGQGQAARSKEYAERIAAEAERLGRVVSNLLGFARLERGNRTVRAEPGDLGQAVAASVERQRAILESAGLRVEGVISRGLAPVVFDRDAIDEIMANLLDNAEKHTRSVPNRFVRVELSEEATGVMLSVTDNGPGIPQSLRRRLFRPFARDGRPGGVGGLGLGLALTRSLVQAQGADWMVAAAPGGGARFTICFPKRGPAG